MWKKLLRAFHVHFQKGMESLKAQGHIYKIKKQIPSSFKDLFSLSRNTCDHDECLWRVDKHPRVTPSR